MLSLEEIRKRLQDRKILFIQADTGLAFTTIQDVRDNKNANPTIKTLLKISDYLEKNQ